MRRDREFERLVTQVKLLEERLSRVEDSIIFRAARGVGSWIAGQHWRYLGSKKPEPEPDPIWYRQLVELENSLLADHSQEWLIRPGISVEGDAEGVKEQVYPARDDGEYVLIANGGRLSPYALYFFADAVRADDVDVAYCDEDRLDAAGNRVDPVFKPGWSPELLHACPYTGGALLVSRRVLELTAGADRDPDSIALKLAGSGLRVRHVPRVLFHAKQAGTPSPRPAPAPLTATPKVSVVICSRSEELLRQCLLSLETTTYPNWDVVVVLHHLDLPLVGRYKGVRYDGPFHWALMNNLGARHANGEIVIALNDDIAVIDPNWMRRLVDHLSRPSVGIAGGKLLYPNGSMQHVGIALGLMEGCGHPGRAQFQTPDWPFTGMTRNVSAVTGACMAFRRDVFDRLGGFSAEFPVNYNDVDFCLRAGDAGYRIVFEPGALLRHDEAQSRRRGTLPGERHTFWRRWEKRLAEPDPYYPVYLRDDSERIERRPVLELLEHLRPGRD